MQVIEVPEQEFEDRHTAGVFLADLLEPLDVATSRFDSGIGGWLALHLIDVIAPAERGGTRNLSGRARSREEGKRRRRHRQLLYSAWFLIREHGGAAEQLAAYQDVVGSRSVVGAGALLHWDPDSAGPRRGFRGKGRGSVAVFRRSYVSSCSPKTCRP